MGQMVWDSLTVNKICPLEDFLYIKIKSQSCNIFLIFVRPQVLQVCFGIPRINIIFLITIASEIVWGFFAVSSSAMNLVSRCYARKIMSDKVWFWFVYLWLWVCTDSPSVDWFIWLNNTRWDWSRIRRRCEYTRVHPRNGRSRLVSRYTHAHSPGMDPTPFTFITEDLELVLRSSQ